MRMADHLKIHHSSQLEVHVRSSMYSKDYSKSDLDVTSPSHREDKAVIPSRELLSHGIAKGEYYKRYEHDEVPVKDSSADEFSIPGADSKDLMKHDLETGMRRQSNVCQELQTDEYSLGSLDSNIKFFKTTVEKIFDNFYTSMRDFELYKKRFQEILDKSKEGSLDGMEDFIKDMFEHIISTDNSCGTVAANVSRMTADTGTEPRDESGSCSGDTSSEPCPSSSLLEAYKNDNYLTDSADESSRVKANSKVEDILNIFLLGDNPCVQIRMNDRKLLSEMNIREPLPRLMSKSIASAENLERVAAKKLEVERYTKQQDRSNNIPDKNIPVKISFAKKNIYLNEDFVRIDNMETSKSLLSKICSVLCKKFRKSTFG